MMSTLSHWRKVRVCLYIILNLQFRQSSIQGFRNRGWGGGAVRALPPYFGRIEVPHFKWIKTYPLDFQTFLGPSDNVLFPVFSDISIELIRLPTYCTQNSKNVISTRACTQLLTSFPSQNHIDLVLHHPSQDALYYLI